MRFVVAAAVTAAILLPQVAAAGPAECQRYNRQISHYQAMVLRSQELGNAMWEARTQRHVDLLVKYRREAGCPEPIDDAGATQALLQLMRLARDAAISYFTFGAL